MKECNFANPSPLQQFGICVRTLEKVQRCFEVLQAAFFTAENWIIWKSKTRLEHGWDGPPAGAQTSKNCCTERSAMIPAGKNEWESRDAHSDCLC